MPISSTVPAAPAPAAAAATTTATAASAEPQAAPVAAHTDAAVAAAAPAPPPAAPAATATATATAPVAAAAVAPAAPAPAPAPAAPAPAVEDPADMADKVGELQKMGWKDGEARAALRAGGFDVGTAAGLLEADEDERKETLAKAAEVTARGQWNAEAAEAAVRQCEGNVTAALEMLEREEEAMGSQFEAAVKDMLENGWEEVVARQALLAQWTLDQRKAAGGNTTVPRDMLDSIRPTLKRANDTKADAAAPATGSKQGTAAGTAAAPQQTQPTPARKEDCVFDVTSENFQKIVLESPVPVLVDVYADWCAEPTLLPT